MRAARYLRTLQFVYYIVSNFTFSGAFVNEIQQSSAWGYYLQDQDFISALILSFNTTQISTFCATFLARYS